MLPLYVAIVSETNIEESINWKASAWRKQIQQLKAGG